MEERVAAQNTKTAPAKKVKEEDDDDEFLMQD